MGSVGKDIEKAVGGVGKAVGLGGFGESQLKSGGEFAMTDSARDAERTTLAQLQSKINGTGTFITDLQYKKAMDDMIKNNQSAAASARGVSNPGLLNRNAMLASQQEQLDLARDSAIAKMQEQAQAQSLAAQISAAQRGVALQGANANLDAQMGIQNQNREFISQLGTGASSYNSKLPTGAAAGAGGGGGAAASGAGGTAAAAAPAAAASDEKLKKDVRAGGADASSVITEFLDALKAHTYEYKHGSDNGRKNPEGEVTSVMAQELEKSPTGKRAVKEGPDGKEVDYAQLMAPMLASMAELNKRMKKLEK